MLANGNVGIGTAEPATPLDLNGAIRLRNGDGSSGAGLMNQISFSYFGSSNYTHSLRSRHDSGSASGNGLDFYLWDFGTDAANATGTKHVLTLGGDGKVGIGTTTPGQKLSVNGTIESTSGGIKFPDGTTQGTAAGAMTSVTLADSATVSVDGSLGSAFNLILGGNRTIANPTNLRVGMYIFKINQDATGGRTITWGTNYLWGQVNSSIPTTVGGYKIFNFYSDGTYLYAMNSFATCESGSQIFATSGTFIVPAGCTIYVAVVGGGGAGSSNYGSAGGSGHVSVGTFAASSLSTTVSVIVGAGGSGSANADGAAGSSSAFGAYLGASGGNPGTGFSGGCRSNANGGSGGSGGGSASANGGSNGSGGSSNGVYCVHGTGGAGAGAFNFASFTISTLSAGAGGAAGGFDVNGGGGGGAGGVNISGTGPTAGSGSGFGGAGYGAGGGGAAFNLAGGNGAAGVVYVEWR